MLMVKTKFFPPFSIILLICLLTNKSLAQGPSFGMAYSQFRPINNMGKHMSINQGVAFDLAYKFGRFRLGVEVGVGLFSNLEFENYPLQGLELQPNTHSIDNETIALYYFLVPRYYVINKGRFKTYINAKLGQVGLTTSLGIDENAQINDGKGGLDCPDRNIGIRDNPFVVGLGMGIELDIVEDIFSIVMEFNHLRGGNIQHLNISEPTSTTSPNFRTFGVDEQEYYTAKIDQSKLRMFDIRLGLLVTIPISCFN